MRWTEEDIAHGAQDTLEFYQLLRDGGVLQGYPTHSGRVVDCA